MFVLVAEGQQVVAAADPGGRVRQLEVRVDGVPSRVDAWFVRMEVGGAGYGLVMTTRMIALLDGSIVDPAQPIVRGDDDGVLRGDGVFDALLAINGVPRDVDDHLDRLSRSASLLGMAAPDAAGYRRGLDALMQAWDWEASAECVVRFIHTRGPAGGSPFGWVLAAPVPAEMMRQREEGVKVLLLDRGFEGTAIAHQPWLLPGAKYLSYAINMAAERYAAEHGADDVVFQTPSGTLLEGPTSGLVLDLDGVLVTPSGEGILRSITVADMLAQAPGAGLAVEVRALHRDEFDRCRGAWLLSSGRRVARITHVDGEPIPTSPLDGQLTDLIGR